jgi:L-asparaginase
MIEVIATKINAEHFKAFTSPNYPELVESGVHLRSIRIISSFTYKDKALLVHKKKMDTNVAIIKMFPGMSEAVLALYFYQRFKRIVLETYGSERLTEDWF